MVFLSLIFLSLSLNAEPSINCNMNVIDGDQSWVEKPFTLFKGNSVEINSTIYHGLKVSLYFNLKTKKYVSSIFQGYDSGDVSVGSEAKTTSALPIDGKINIEASRHVTDYFKDKDSTVEIKISCDFSNYL